MKIVFAGTPEFAVLPLQKIIEHGGNVVGVITQTDKPQGRKGILTPPPVKTVALNAGLPVLQPQKIKEEIEDVKALGGDVLITCAYGQILTQEVLDAFPLGVWNIHAGLLPKYRGASPIQSCILAGETETGVSIMKTELGLDSGDILLVERTPIGEKETCGELSARLSEIGAELIVNALKLLESGNYTLEKQSADGVNVVRKIGKEQAKIDFSKTAKEIENLVRAMNPEPTAYTAVNGLKVNVYAVEECALPQDVETASMGEVLTDSPKKGLIVRCRDGAIKILELQASGGKRMKGSDFLNGRKVTKGDVFEC
ncbi:MAG: methionyl-tRNA formyltransferase [Clostridia bacterium]|nr:methionyl-tRNA formyltransferase [Clostridia bacterium]